MTSASWRLPSAVRWTPLVGFDETGWQESAVEERRPAGGNEATERQLRPLHQVCEGVQPDVTTLCENGDDHAREEPEKEQRRHCEKNRNKGPRRALCGPLDEAHLRLCLTRFDRGELVFCLERPQQISLADELAPQIGFFLLTGGGVGTQLEKSRLNPPNGAVSLSDLALEPFHPGICLAPDLGLFSGKELISDRIDQLG